MPQSETIDSDGLTDEEWLSSRSTRENHPRTPGQRAFGGSSFALALAKDGRRKSERREEADEAPLRQWNLGADAESSNEGLVASYQRGDLRALDELLDRNERLLHHTLKRFSGSSEQYQDLFQVARIGLVKAAQRFDPGRGLRFSTYAVAIVDGEVRHHLRDSLLLRQPRWAQSLYATIQEAQAAFYQREHRAPTISELAEQVNVREEGVLEIIRVFGGLSLHSLNEPFGSGPGADGLDRSLIRARRPETFSLPVEDRILLYEALGALSDIQRKIIYLVFFVDLTQQEVADEIGMNQRAVSREQVKALERLKAILRKRLF
jgi:RNA polymerase sigma-B factor